MDSNIIKQEIDISSLLPEIIFGNIISWLPVREAVRTSVLVKRWKDAWKYVTRLHLNPAEMLGSSVGIKHLQADIKRKEMEALISCTSLFTSIIQSIHNGVNHCQVDHFVTNIVSGELNEWVKLLAKKKSVKSLILKCIAPREYSDEILSRDLVLPPGIFSDLESLQLTNYSLSDVSPFHSCKKLRILELIGVTLLNNESLTGIVSCCENLEDLRLRGCFGLTELQICNRNLKLLELNFLSVDRINISAEALVTLILDEIFCLWSSVYINAPRVTEFQAYGSISCKQLDAERMYFTTEELLERFSGILSRHDGSHPSYSSPMGYVSPFMNLKLLSTCLDLTDIRHAILISYIFRVCSHLEKLNITVENRCSAASSFCYPVHLYWERQEVFDSIYNCLRAVSIKNFRGKVLEREFLKYLITNAPRMQRIFVDCNAECKGEEVTTTLSLLSLPRASMDVSVVIETPKARASGKMKMKMKKKKKKKKKKKVVDLVG